MKEFELKLGATTYQCSSNAYDKAHNNWSINAKFHDLNINMNIPIDSKVPLEKVLVFISSFHEALNVVQAQKSKELTFINQLT